MRESNRIRKKTVLLIAVIVLSAAVLLALIPFVLSEIFQPDNPMPEFHFADPSLSADIEADADYMALDQSVHYVTADGVTVELAEKDYVHYDSAVQKLIRFVFAARAGDASAYNACFAPEYLEASGWQAAFTMQKIYDIYVVKYVLAAGTAVPEGYEEVALYGLRYKIKDNNGSLRADMDSDGVHEQYITVVTDADDNAWVYGIQLQYRR